MKLNLLASCSAATLLLACSAAFATSPKLGVSEGGTGGTDAPSARAGIGAAASGPNADITALYKGTPSSFNPQAQADFNAAIAMPHFMAQSRPIVCVGPGDSTMTPGASPVAPTDLMIGRIQQRIIAGNPDKTITASSFPNYAIGGSYAVNFLDPAYVPSTYPSWWANHSLTWAQAMAADTAANNPCDSVLIGWGINAGISATGDKYQSAIAAMASTFVKVPDFVIVTNETGNPQNGIDANAASQASQLSAAGLLRTMARNPSWLNLASVPALGLIDRGRYEALAVLGVDPTMQPLTNTSLSGAVTMPYTFSQQNDGDFDMTIAVSSIAAWIAGGNQLVLTTGASDGGVGVACSQINFLPSGLNLLVTHFWGCGLSKALPTAVGVLPASGFVTLRITAIQDHIVITASNAGLSAPVSVADYTAPRVVGPFTPKLSWTGTAPAATVTINSYSTGKMRSVLPVMTPDDYWGVSPFLNGGSGTRHPSSLGVALAVGQAFQGVSFGAARPNMPSALGLTAAGTTQADALQLSSTYNQITTCAAGAGAVLFGSSQNLQEVVVNTSANACLIYPAGSSTINAGPPGSAYSLDSGASAIFYVASPTTWLAVSGGNTGGVPKTKVTVYTAGSYTYTPAPGLVAVRFGAWSAGGPGGGGPRQATGAACSGGSGGGGGGFDSKELTAAQVGGSLALVVGAGATGGAGASSDNAAGAAGSSGGDTSIAGHMLIKGGAAGAGGQLAGNSGGGGAGAASGFTTPTAGTSSAAGTGGYTPTGDGGFGATAANVFYQNSGSGGGGGKNGLAGGAGGYSVKGGSGGGAGGGIDAGNTPLAGAASGVVLNGSSISSRGLGGAVDNPGSAGAAPNATDAPGSGGGGGGASLTSSGNGGAGDIAGGGGGAGCVRNGGTAGTGGASGGGKIVALELL